MLYPKCFEKQAVDAGAIADRFVQPAINTVRRILRINSIANNKVPAIAAVETMPEQQQQPIIDQQAAYIDDAGVIYPRVFGYQVPEEFIPRKLKPVLRNLPEGEI